MASTAWGATWASAAAWEATWASAAWEVTWASTTSEETWVSAATAWGATWVSAVSVVIPFCQLPHWRSKTVDMGAGKAGIDRTFRTHTTIGKCREQLEPASG